MEAKSGDERRSHAFKADDEEHLLEANGTVPGIPPDKSITEAQRLCQDILKNKNKYAEKCLQS